MRKARTTIDDLLRRSRPEAPEHLVRALAARTAPPRTRYRAAMRVAVLSAAVVAGLSSVGGLGYAMSFATHLVVKAKSHATYAKQPKLVTLHVNAALDQYSTTTTTTSGGGGAVGPAPVLTSESPADGATVQSVSSIELGADHFVDWFNMRVTAPDGSVTTLDDRQGTSQLWSFSASAQGAYTVSGTINANNGSGAVGISTHFTIFVPASSGGGGTAPPVQATAPPTQSGALASADGSATVVWPAHAFGDAPVVVQVAPVPPAQVQNLPPNSVVVNVSATTMTGAAVTALGGVVEIQFPNVPPGVAPLVSQDNATWRPVPELTSPQLPEGQADGFFRDSAKTIHLFTRHLTYFALALQTAQSKLAIQVVAPVRVWTTGRDFVALQINLTVAARITTSWVDAKGRTVATQTTHTLSAGTNFIRLHLPRLAPGTYKLVLRASGLGQTATTVARIRISATQPPLPAPSAGRPLGIVVVRGAQVAGLNQLGAKLGSKFSVTTTLNSQLLQAVDPRTSHTVAVLVDFDEVPISLIASLHAVLPEVQIVGLTTDPATALLARKAGAALVIAKPTSVSTLSQTVRAIFRP
jgi:hypothetical protein